MRPLSGADVTNSAFAHAVLKEKGGLLELSDLAAHKSELVTPISYTYHDSFTLHECPPNGQGLTPLIALGIIEEMQALGLIDLEGVPYMGTAYCHAVIEALRLAFADTRAYIADAEHGHVPVEELLNKVRCSLNLIDFSHLRGTQREPPHRTTFAPAQSYLTPRKPPSTSAEARPSRRPTRCISQPPTSRAMHARSFSATMPVSARASYPRTVVSRSRTEALASRSKRGTRIVSR